MGTKLLGGRGKKAPYETTHIRVPVPIKEDVERLIEEYRQKLLTGNTLKKDNLLTSLSEAKEIAKKLVRSKKSSRVSMAKLLSEIYKTTVTTEDLNPDT